MRMTLDRRLFLRLMGLPVLLPGVSLQAVAQGAEDALFLLVDGIGPATPADRLGGFIDPLLYGEIPFGLVLRPPELAEPDLPVVLGATIRRILAAAPSRVEPALSLPGLAGQPVYFQRRITSDAMAWLAHVLADTHPRSPLTIVTEAETPASFDGLRSLGVRTVLSPGAPLPVGSTGCASLAGCLSGATTLAIARTADPASVIGRALDQPGWAQVLFSLEGIEQASVADARLRGQRVVDAVAREMDRGRRFLALPRDHALWFGADQPRYVGLRLAAPAEGEGPARDRMAATLRELGLPFSDTVAADAGRDGGLPGGACLDLAGMADPARLSWPAGARCAVAGAAPDGLPLAGAAALDLMVTRGGQTAIDTRGLLQRGETRLSEASVLLEDSDRMRDALLVLRPGDYLTDAARETTLTLMQGLRADPATRLVDLPGFIGQTVVPDPVFDLLRTSRRDPVEPDDPDPLSAEDWLADARQAWTFFERFTNPETGLCIDTGDIQPDGEWLHRELTMWDMGSLIEAVMAAQELGLISDADFVHRAEQLVRALPVARIGGLRLPSEVISSDTAAPLSSDFNACDTGRLLSVLRELDAHPLTPGIAADKVGQWDLAGVIVDDHVHSVVNGMLVDRFRSHCAHYTARAFRDRGLTAASPYEVAGPGSPTDHEMRLLLGIGDLGPLGAEPLLFEALEMGLSPPSRLLASVLFSAQKADFQRTGTLRCVSEAPLNRAPWFTYQGLDLAAPEDNWMVAAASDAAAYATPDFRLATALVNTKAAYLWAAQRPGPYATGLVRHVRSRAGVDAVGFSPGVFIATGQGMPGYVDVNTNGVVLQAIAFMLRGRKPRGG